MLRWLLYVALALVAAVAGALLIGFLLPVGHRAAGSRSLPASPDQVFAAISQFARLTEWRTDIDRIEVAGEAGVGQTIVEHGSNGAIPYRVEAIDPPRRLVTRIAGDALPFGGTWTFEVAPDPSDPGRSILTVTEDGEIYNPAFRFMARFVFGYQQTIDLYLRDIARKFGE